jgi:carboxyl-terminal processing protease
MERSHRVVLAVLTALALVVMTFSLGFALGARAQRAAALGSSLDVAEAGDGVDVITEAYERILSNAVDPPTPEALARGAIRGMVRVLQRRGEDPYALFYSPDGYRSFQELTTGRFSGIGVWLKLKGADLEIVSVLPSTPAKQAGLQRGDVVRTIDGTDVADLDPDEAVARIKGPEGTAVRLGIERAGELIELTLTRRSIELPSLTARLLDGGLGYVRLIGFARNAGRQLRQEVADLIQRGASGVVLDLRDNGGGLFTEAIEVASTFIEDGDVVIYRERGGDDVVYQAEGDAFEDIPLVVLVNEGTASASEIVAGALKDTERAVLVGTRTYGKGSVQEVLPLPDASALKLTIAAYLTPSGHSIDGRGIEPDVVVEAPAEQRARALEILRGIVVSQAGAQG